MREKNDIKGGLGFSVIVRIKMGDGLCISVLCQAQPLKPSFKGVHAVAKENWLYESLT